MKYLLHLVRALSTMYLPFWVWSTGAIQKLVYFGSCQPIFQILSCFHLHFYTLLLCKTSTVIGSQILSCFNMHLLLETSAVIGWSDFLGGDDMSHIALFAYRKMIWLI